MKSFAKQLMGAVIGLGMIVGFSSPAFSHCQVPCGIFDDHARVHQMLEDSVTVIKAASMMAELAGKTDAQSVNQMTRWVMNKESHAQKIIETISDYYLTQRVKTDQADYIERLKTHHAVMLAAMKAKQSADKSYGLALQKAIQALEKYYP
ncbi:MAG: superoxide dismutase, Ni [Desulfobacterales bacterium]|nr:superoxide dismutase, Ni [Desulfobacterales bacterium]